MDEFMKSQEERIADWELGGRDNSSKNFSTKG